MNVTIQFLEKRSFVFAVMRREMSKAESDHTEATLLSTLISGSVLLGRWR
jgi:hypothetical protein